MNEINKHDFDVIIVGGGGAGLRAAVSLARSNLKIACISKVFPTRSHTVAAQGGISAALGNVEKDNWKWHMYDTVKGSDWLGDQDAIEYMCKEAADSIIELENFGVPFSRDQDGRIYQRAFGGMTKNFGKGGIAKRTCAASDRTGHSILHTLYQQCMKHKVEFFIEYHVTDLLSEDKEVLGVFAYSLCDGTLHQFNARKVILATGGYGKVYKFATSAHICTGDGGGMVLRAGFPVQDMEFVQFHPTGLYGVGCLISEAARGEGGYLLNANKQRFMENYAPKAKDLASRDVVSRAIAEEIQKGRGCGENKDHVLLNLSNLGEDILKNRLPGIMEHVKLFKDIDIVKDPIPVVPTVHYNMGGIPTNMNTEVLYKEKDSLKVVKGLFAIGESACVSVHGANRLGSNSLLDIIVFGKRCGEYIVNNIDKRSLKEPKKSTIKAVYDRFERIKNSTGSIKIAELRDKMQEVMQDHVAVFREGKTLKKGKELMFSLYKDFNKIGLGDHSLIYNSELQDALELENLLLQGIATVSSALKREESRGAHTRIDYPDRDDMRWSKHTLFTFYENDYKIEYRDVKLKGGSVNFPYEKRVY